LQAEKKNIHLIQDCKRNEPLKIHQPVPTLFVICLEPAWYWCSQQKGGEGKDVFFLSENDSVIEFLPLLAAFKKKNMDPCQQILTVIHLYCSPGKRAHLTAVS
jgi:hypothetical protein